MPETHCRSTEYSTSRTNDSRLSMVAALLVPQGKRHIASRFEDRQTKNTIQEGSRIMKCEKCGHEIADRSTAQTICLECPNCGWGFATTRSQTIDEDMTDYKTYLNPGNAVAIENIKLISAICHVNYMQARKLLSSQEPVIIYKAEQEAVSSLSKAGKVLQTAKSLKKSSLVFSIIPDFPYEIT